MAIPNQNRFPVKDARHKVAETGFSVPYRNSSFPRKERLTRYPDILWNYDAFYATTHEAEPITVSVEVQIKDREASQRVRTFSVRSINECLIGYNDKKNRFLNNGVLFAAYVNEDSPLIDKILREALNTRIVNRFMGYQNKRKDYVDKAGLCPMERAATAQVPLQFDFIQQSFEQRGLFPTRTDVGRRLWLLRKSTAWTAAYCSPPCSAPSTSTDIGAYSGAHVCWVLHRPQS